MDHFWIFSIQETSHLLSPSCRSRFGANPFLLTLSLFSFIPKIVIGSLKTFQEINLFFWWVYTIYSWFNCELILGSRLEIMQKKREICEYRDKLDKTLSSPDLINEQTLKSLLRKQLYSSQGSVLLFFLLCFYCYINTLWDFVSCCCGHFCRV